MYNRFLNAAYAIEVINGRLNGSSDNVENKKSAFDNVSYIKKIGNKATVSAQCQKYAIKRFAEKEGYELSKKIKNGKKIYTPTLPHKYIDEDVFGFMRADKEELNTEQFDQLKEEERKTFSKNKNKYVRNITKKRRSRFMMSPLINVSNSKINVEWNVASTEGDYMPYTVETSAGIFVGISNINISNISQFTISKIDSEYRDYSVKEFNQEDIKVSNYDKLERIKTVLKGLQYLSIQGNQNNYLTDTSPKFIILGEYSWGNNVFQGIIKRNGVDVEALEETLEENENFRLSDIWIGVSKRIISREYENLKDKLKSSFKKNDYVHISTVKEAFDNYFIHLCKSFECEK